VSIQIVPNVLHVHYHRKYGRHHHLRLLPQVLVRKGHRAHLKIASMHLQYDEKTHHKYLHTDISGLSAKRLLQRGEPDMARPGQGCSRRKREASKRHLHYWITFQPRNEHTLIAMHKCLKTAYFLRKWFPLFRCITIHPSI